MLSAAIRAYRGEQTEIAGIEALLDDPTTRRRNARAGARRACEAARQARGPNEHLRIALLPKDAADEKQRHSRNARRHRRRRGGAVRRRSLPHVSALCRAKGWSVEILSASEGALGGFKEIVAEIVGRGVFRAAEIRIGRASRSARARDRNAGPHPYLRGDRRRPAASRRRRCRHQRQGSEDRDDALAAAPAASTSTRPNSAIRITHLPTGIVV